MLAKEPFFDHDTMNKIVDYSMDVALARKLLIALWHFVHDGVVPEGVVLRPAH